MERDPVAQGEWSEIWFHNLKRTTVLIMLIVLVAKKEHDADPQ